MSVTEPSLQLDQVQLLVPAASSYAEAARIIGDGLRLRPEQIVDAATPVADQVPVIAVGNMMDSAFLRRLYLALDDTTDRAWPGPGGWALRSCPTPMSRSGPVLIVSVSAAADAPAAARALVDRVAEAQAVPYLHDVQLGRHSHLYLGAAKPFLSEPATPWDQTGGAGDWDYMMLIARMGMAAVKVGDPQLVQTFIGQILRFAEVRFFARDRDDPIMIHGFLRHMLIPFALLEHHPAITVTERQAVTEALLALLRSTEGAANERLLSDGRHWRVRQNHATRTALDVFTCGRYFHQVHGLDEATEWMQLAHGLFEPQLASSKPVEDSWGHQWRATLYNTADYALQAGLDEYVHGPVFTAAAERALLAHTNLETGPLLYLLMAAVATGDPSYLRPALREGEDVLVEKAVADLGGDETGRSWVTGEAAREPALTGLQVAPLSRLFYDCLEEYDEYAPEGVYERDVAWEETFDKVAWRTGWDAEDDYLLLDGVSGGSHAYQDANAIIRFTSGGYAWFGGPDYGKWSTASVREHCAVSVVVDGQGPGRESRYARLVQRGQVPGAHSVSTELSYPDMARWRRQVICAEAGWYVCVDEVEALVEGAFLVEGRWNVLGEVESSSTGLIARQGKATLCLQAMGHQDMQRQSMIDRDGLAGHRWILRTAADLRAGEVLRLITAWRVSTAVADVSPHVDAEGPSDVGVGLGLEATAAGCRVAGVDLVFGDVVDFSVVDGNWCLPGAKEIQDGSAERFQLGSRTPLMPVWQLPVAPITALATTDTTGIIGQADGGLRWIDAEGNLLSSGSTDAAVRAIAPLAEARVVVGGDDATVRVFDGDGRLQWARQIEWQPMSWEYWTRLHCGIVSLLSIDLDGDGEMEIVAGCADRHLYAFDGTGELLWRTACQWGVPTCLAGATSADGARRVLAGMSQPSIHGWCRVHDGAGRFLHALQRPDIVCWSIPSWMRVLCVADIDGDGRDEVVTGLDTNHRQLIAYDLEGDILWDADLGGPVTAAIVVGATIIAGTSNGTVAAYESATGERRWHRFLPGAIHGITAGAHCLLVCLEDGRVVVLDDEGVVQRTSPAHADATLPLADSGSAGACVATWGAGILVGANGCLSYFDSSKEPKAVP